MEQLLGVDISNLNRFDPSLQTLEPRDQIWMTPGTAFWLVGTLLMERGMLRSIKARADLSAATFEAALGRGRQRRAELPCQSGARIQGWGTPTSDNAVR